MNVTREVINDLWPLYAAGEASADSRKLVEAYLSQDPEYASLLQGPGKQIPLGHEIPELPPDREAQSLRRTKRLLHGHDWLLFVAMLFSCFSFGRIVSDTSWDVSPVNFIVVASIAAIFWIAFFTRLILVRKTVYRVKSKNDA
jgi:hypothetical protein